MAKDKPPTSVVIIDQNTGEWIRVTPIVLASDYEDAT